MNLALCPLCHNRDSRILFNAKTPHSLFSIKQCRRCGLAVTDPFPNDDILNIHDPSQYYGKKESKFVPVFQNLRDILSKRRAVNYLAMISTSTRRPKVLDIGCAEGRLLNSFLEYGCECYGIEHPSYPKERFINSNSIRYITGDLKDIDFKKDFFDIIILWHVLEHVDYPDIVIRRVHDLLSPGGIFIMAVPNFSSMESRIFKQSWFHLDIPWHKYHFTEKSIKYIIEENNFQIVKSSTFCLEQGVYGIVQSILNSMGWPRNELYEAIKGNIHSNRIFSLIIQSFIFLLILIPCFLISFSASKEGKGSVLEFILRK